MKIADHFPVLYRNILPDFFETDIIKEISADCANCIMLKPKKPVFGQEYFSDDSKCCTFFPDIPNYLIGFLLSDDSKNSQRGKQLINEIISTGVGVTPKGIIPGKKYSHLYKISRENTFGKSSSLICPFYDKNTGNCNMWEARTAICSTYFCRYNNGKDGENFWSELKLYFRKAENILSDYAMFANGFISKSEYEQPENRFTSNDIDNTRPTNYQEIWANWNNREHDFYIKSYYSIKDLNKKQFSEIMGFTGIYQIEKIKNQLKILTAPVIPHSMILNPEISIRPSENEDYIILSESGVFKISNILFDVLKRFNGANSTQDIIKYFLNKDIDIETDLLISFYQQRILIPTES